MSYSLSMIPDKPRALQNALRLLKSGGEGFLGIADFWMEASHEEDLAFPYDRLRKVEAEVRQIPTPFYTPSALYPPTYASM